jgi:hypothetical protein
MHHKQQRQNRCNNVSPRDMVCLGNTCMGTLHKGNNDNNNNNNNNNNICSSFIPYIHLHPANEFTDYNVTLNKFCSWRDVRK